MRLQAYTDLFQDLAARHRAIQYTAANQRFMRLTVSADPIARQLDLTDFYTKLKSKLKALKGQPFLVLQNYQLDYADNNGEHFTREPHGAFYVLQTSTPGHAEERDAVTDACEGVAEDILAAVIHQLRATYRVRISLNDCFAEHIGPVGDHYVGVRMNFTWSETATRDLTYDPTKFLS
jgi:hypothetical protein